MIGNFTRHSRQGLSDISPAPNTYVRDPDSGGRAKRGGLAEGDIIVGFKIRPYTSIDDLHRALVGAEIGVEFCPDGNSRDRTHRTSSRAAGTASTRMRQFVSKVGQPLAPGGDRNQLIRKLAFLMESQIFQNAEKQKIGVDR